MRMIDYLQVGRWLWAQLGTEPYPLPHSAFMQQTAQAIEALTQNAHQSSGRPSAVAMDVRPGRRSETSRSYITLGSVFHSAAISEREQRCHAQHEPVPRYVRKVCSACQLAVAKTLKMESAVEITFHDKLGAGGDLPGLFRSSLLLLRSGKI